MPEAIAPAAGGAQVERSVRFRPRARERGVDLVRLGGGWSGSGEASALGVSTEREARGLIGIFLGAMLAQT